MAYNFAVSYLYQYPAEKVGPSSFACDETIRNANFDSKLKALAVPVSEIEQPIFDMLDDQTFTLHVDFINTAIPCSKVSLWEVVESVTDALSDASCSAAGGTVSMRAVLDQHTITVRAVVEDIQLVGGVRVGLSGVGQETKSRHVARAEVQSRILQ